MPTDTKQIRVSSTGRFFKTKILSPQTLNPQSSKTLNLINAKKPKTYKFSPQRHALEGPAALATVTALCCYLERLGLGFRVWVFSLLLGGV